MSKINKINRYLIGVFILILFAVMLNNIRILKKRNDFIHEKKVLILERNFTNKKRGTLDKEIQLKDKIAKMYLGYIYINIFIVLMIFLFVILLIKYKSYLSYKNILEKSLLDLMDTIKEPIYIKNKKFNYIFANTAYKKIFHLENIYGKKDYEIFDEKSAKEIELNDKYVFEFSEEINSSEQLLIKGEKFIFNSQKRPVLIDKSVEALICFGESNVKNKSDEDAEIINLIIENLEEAVVILREDLTVIAINSAYSKITGYKSDEMIGEKSRIIDNDLYEKDFSLEIIEAINKGDNWEGEAWDKRKNGELYPRWIKIVKMSMLSSGKELYIGLFGDLTQRKEQEKNILKLKNYDILTNLPNKRLFEENIDIILKESNRKFIILNLDIDNFRYINETLGYEYGDELLKKFADIVSDIIGEKNIISRFRADEFELIIREEKDIENIDKILKKIINSIQKPFIIESERLFITISMGLGFYPKDGDSAKKLIKNTNTALKAAKNSGKNRFIYYSEELDEKSNEKLKLKKDLIRAVKNEEFFLVYQPQIDMLTGTLVGAEALIRWNHPERGLISPVEFIPLAEESGVIREMGIWILEEACREAFKWQQRGLNLLIAINISVEQFKENGIVKKILDIVEKNDVNPQNVEIEITEGILIEDISGTISKLETLKKRGIKIAIDDFGTGYSSLSYLKRFPIDKLKIDRSFICDIPQKDDGGIAKAIIEIGHTLGVRVIGEGVETADQLAFLVGKNCDEIQGYYYSKPLKPATFIEFAEEFNYV